MPRAVIEPVAQPIFQEPVFNEAQQEVVPPYFSTPNDGDTKVYNQVQDLLTKDVVGFDQSRLDDAGLYGLSDAYGQFYQNVENNITVAKQIVFDVIGDSGASDKGYYQDELSVAAALTNYINSTPGANRPSFLYHVGDIVYSFGEAQYYFDQFYSPYRNYSAPIIAIPGNHDSFVIPGTPAGQTPLDTFMRNFCATELAVTSEARSLHRTAMTQPGVYFALDAPFVRIIGLFSNALEDPGVISSEGGKWAAVPDYQLTFLQAQLTQIKTEGYKGAVIIATHHPHFSYAPPPGGPGGGGGHGGNPGMLAEIDKICEAVGVYPHAFMTGHVHNYQRFTRTVTFGGQQRSVPFIICGASGHHINRVVQAKRGQSAQEPGFNIDVSYLDPDPVVGPTTLTLEQYEDSDYGYMRVTVDDASLRFDYYTATPRSGTKPFDSVTVNL